MSIAASSSRRASSAARGAERRRAGRFEQSHEGTIFLDEIGEIPAATQIKLLTVLQDRRFERVGGNEPIKIDVRIVAATNRDLAADVRGGSARTSTIDSTSSPSRCRLCALADPTS